MRSKHIAWLAVVASVALMFAANLVGNQLNRFFLAVPGIDKVLHFCFQGMSRPLLKFGGGSVEILRDVGD